MEDTRSKEQGTSCKNLSACTSNLVPWALYLEPF